MSEKFTGRLLGRYTRIAAGVALAGGLTLMPAALGGVGLESALAHGEDHHHHRHQGPDHHQGHHHGHHHHHGGEGGDRGAGITFSDQERQVLALTLSQLPPDQQRMVISSLSKLPPETLKAGLQQQLLAVQGSPGQYIQQVRGVSSALAGLSPATQQVVIDGLVGVPGATDRATTILTSVVNTNNQLDAINSTLKRVGQSSLSTFVGVNESLLDSNLRTACALGGGTPNGRGCDYRVATAEYAASGLLGPLGPSRFVG